MKKKIGDLTFKEAKEICDKDEIGFPLCRDECPLYNTICGCFVEDFNENDLDQEIEVEE